MRLRLATFLVVLGLSGLIAIGQETSQETPVPPKPTCMPLFKTGTCADLWRNYNQALAERLKEEIQSYVERQKDLASQSATAPLQQQIANLNELVSDQQNQINKLQIQMQSDAAAALDAESADHQKGSRQGFEAGVGATVLLLVVIYLIMRFTRSFTITRKTAIDHANRTPPCGGG